MERISVGVSLSNDVTVASFIKWWSWIIRLVVFSWFTLIRNFILSGIESINLAIENKNFQPSCILSYIQAIFQ